MNCTGLAALSFGALAAVIEAAAITHSGITRGTQPCTDWDRWHKLSAVNNRQALALYNMCLAPPNHASAAMGCGRPRSRSCRICSACRPTRLIWPSSGTMCSSEPDTRLCHQWACTGGTTWSPPPCLRGEGNGAGCMRVLGALPQPYAQQHLHSCELWRRVPAQVKRIHSDARPLRFRAPHPPDCSAAGDPSHIESVPVTAQHPVVQQHAPHARAVCTLWPWIRGVLHMVGTSVAGRWAHQSAVHTTLHMQEAVPQQHSLNSGLLVTPCTQQRQCLCSTCQPSSPV